MNLQGHVRRQANRFNLPLLGRWFIFGSLVGIVAGLGAIVFQYLCQLTVHLFLDLGTGYRPTEPAGEAALLARGGGTLRLWALALCPAVGGLLAGLLVYTLAPTAEGHGTDSAIDAYHRRRGQTPVRVPLVKLIASALTIGSGGREGPIALIGAGFGSFPARLLHLPERDRRILLAAGVGAGVGSIFRAPLAGALFAAEILYSEPEFESDDDRQLPAAVAGAVGLRHRLPCRKALVPLPQPGGDALPVPGSSPGVLCRCSGRRPGGRASGR